MKIPTAAALVVGNEILSGKIREANVYALARVLRSLGVQLARVVVIGDLIDVIAREARELSERHDHVFTSGGVGPTHDDLTIAGIARGFGVPVVRNSELEALIRRYYGEGVNEGHLALAQVPEGSRLLYTDRSPWPAALFRNVWILPGIPEIFEMKLAIVAKHLADTGTPFVTRAVYTKLDEPTLKPLLDATVAAHPRVEVGSYPRWNDPAYETKITFDGKDEGAVLRAFEEFLKVLPEGEPQWTE